MPCHAADSLHLPATFVPTALIFRERALRFVLCRAAGCVTSKDPGAYKIRSGAVPDRGRGLGHTAPTYTCRDPAGSTLERLRRLCILSSLLTPPTSIRLFSRCAPARCSARSLRRRPTRCGFGPLDMSPVVLGLGYFLDNSYVLQQTDCQGRKADLANDCQAFHALLEWRNYHRCFAFGNFSAPREGSRSQR